MGKTQTVMSNSEVAVKEGKTSLEFVKDAPVSSKTGRRFQKNWFLNRSDDLSVVTDESYNEALGIRSIQMQKATQKQLDTGILCTVSLETVTGWDYGITIWETKDHPGDIMLMLNGAQATGQVDGRGKMRYNRDRRLNDAATAQILSHVWKHLSAKK